MKPTTPYKRTDRIAELIKKELSSMLLIEVKDPRTSRVNITHVSVTRDLSIAKIQFLVYGLDDPNTVKARRSRVEAEAGLDRASGFLRRELGKRLDLRITPRLNFYWDNTVEKGRRMDELFAELEEERTMRSKDDEG
jgi:ribosome-binding factor A